uniref:Uncharacterized protein n=1 Tax=Knipowitschia caucasica TaxID=637954 RepID=A0AAV2MEU3_KNICA
MKTYWLKGKKDLSFKTPAELRYSGEQKDAEELSSIGLKFLWLNVSCQQPAVVWRLSTVSSHTLCSAGPLPINQRALTDPPAPITLKPPSHSANTVCF